MEVVRERGDRSAMERQVDLKKELRQTSMVCYAMMASLAVYPVLVEVLDRMEGWTPIMPQGDLPRMREVFFMMALVALVLIRFARGALMKVGESGDVKTRVARLKTAQLVTFALCEIPAILGFVLFLLQGFFKEVHVFTIFSLVLMLLYLPRLEHWVVWLRK